MIPFQFFLYSLLIVLIHGQNHRQQHPTFRNRASSRQWVRERIRLADRRNRIQEERQTPVNLTRQQEVEAPQQQLPQAAVRPGQRRQEEPQGINRRVGIPMTWRELVAVNNVTDLEGFVNLLVTPEGHPVRAEDLFVTNQNSNGKIVIAGSDEELAAADECSPRNMSVRLDADVTDPGVAYYPECTVMQRCGGCTPSPYLACVPRYKEIVVKWVLKAHYPFPGSLSMEVVGFAPVPMERHLSCQVACKLKREDCTGPDKIYHEGLCRCDCVNRRSCSSNKEWSDEDCTCRCRNIVPCCERQGSSGRRCPLFFDHDSCECTLKESVGADPNASQEEIEAWLASRHNITAHTTTETPTTSSAQCPELTCPMSMVAVMLRRGRCLCQFPNRIIGD